LKFSIFFVAMKMSMGLPRFHCWRRKPASLGSWLANTYASRIIHRSHRATRLQGRISFRLAETISLRLVVRKRFAQIRRDLGCHRAIECTPALPIRVTGFDSAQCTRENTTMRVVSDRCLAPNRLRDSLDADQCNRPAIGLGLFEVHGIGWFSRPTRSLCGTCVADTRPEMSKMRRQVFHRRILGLLMLRGWGWQKNMRPTGE
jgi:hypothetical protein